MSRQALRSRDRLSHTVSCARRRSSSRGSSANVARLRARFADGTGEGAVAGEDPGRGDAELRAVPAGLEGPEVLLLAVRKQVGTVHRAGLTLAGAHTARLAHSEKWAACPSSFLSAFGSSCAGRCLQGRRARQLPFPVKPMAYDNTLHASCGWGRTHAPSVGGHCLPGERIAATPVP